MQNGTPRTRPTARAAEHGEAARPTTLVWALRLAVAGLLTLLVAACGGGEEEMGGGEMAGEAPAGAAGETVVISGVGFQTPESVLHDTDADVYLVSNINGTPVEMDGNGFISRLSPTGEVLELKWIDGAAEGVTLNAPKGMAIQNGTLYVADIDCVRMFDAATGAPAGEVCPEEAVFLNDVAPHPEGGVLLTDSGLDSSFSPTGADAIYHVAGDEAAAVVAGPDFGAPTGITVHDGEAYVVTFMSGQIFLVTGVNQREELAAVEGAQFDGIEFLEDGRALVSNWASSCIHVLATDGSLECVMPDLEAPADIGVDHQRGRVLVPLFNANEVRFIPLG